MIDMGSMKKRLMWNTRIGPFYIDGRPGGYFIVYNDDPQGPYPTPQHAVDDLVGGHTYSIYHRDYGPVDTSELGFPVDALEWERINTA